MEENNEFECIRVGLCADCLKEFRDNFVAEIEGEPSAYEKGKIDLFNELIELLEKEEASIEQE